MRFDSLPGAARPLPGPQGAAKVHLGLGLAKLMGSAQPAAQIGIKSFRPSHGSRSAPGLAGEKHQSLTIHPGRVPAVRHP